MPYVRTRLGRLYFDERGERSAKGDAPAIVLLHGLLFDGGMWAGQIEPLSALGRVLVFDGPGHGKSEPPPRFMLEEHADAIFDALGELDVPRAVLVGLSWGGMIAMRLALQHPPSVSGLALIDTSAEDEPLAKRVKYRALIALHRRVGTPWALFRREVAPLMFGPRTLEARPELVEAAYRRMSGFDREGSARAGIAVVVHRTNVLPRLGQIHVPTLVMCGTEDKTLTMERSEAIARAIPGAELVRLEGLGHMSALEDSAAVNARLVPFVRDVVASSPAS